MSGRHEHRYSYSSEESGNRHEEENQLVPVVNNNQALVPMYQKHVAPPGTYVVQIPKDQIYRIPPPENARRFENYTRKGKKKSGPSCCCCALFWIIGILLFLGFLAVIASVIFYIVLRPKALQYSVENFSIKGLDGNLTLSSSSSSLKLSPEFDVTLKSQNPNGKISFFYFTEGSSVTVSYSDVELSTGTFETFYQPHHVCLQCYAVGHSEITPQLNQSRESFYYTWSGKQVNWLKRVCLSFCHLNLQLPPHHHHHLHNLTLQ